MIRNIEKRQKQIDDMITKLYMDNVSGRIDDERLERMVRSLDEESKTNSSKIAELRDSIEAASQVTDNYRDFFKLVKQATHIETLTQDIVRTFIDRIEVSERILPEGITIAGPKTPYKQEIRIFYRFIGDISGEPVREVSRDEAS